MKIYFTILFIGLVAASEEETFEETAAEIAESKKRKAAYAYRLTHPETWPCQSQDLAGEEESVIMTGKCIAPQFRNNLFNAVEKPLRYAYLSQHYCGNLQT